jgi:hypothetical protein
VFLGHIAVALAGKRAAPEVALGTWILAVQLVDLIWPLFLLIGLEHVRIVPGITAFTPLDFYDYPLTHSLVAGIGWAVLLAGVRVGRGTRAATAFLLAAGVLSHWALDVISHRPDVPVMPNGPYLGLGLWDSIPGTLIVELTMFAGGLWLYVESGAAGAKRISFWLLIAVMLAAYLAAAFGPPPPDVLTLALSALSMWLLVVWAGFADRPGSIRPTAARQEQKGEGEKGRRGG